MIIKFLFIFLSHYFLTKKMDDTKFFFLYNELKKDEKTRFLKWIKQHHDETKIETFFLNVIEKDRREKFPLSEQEKMQKIWDKSFPKKEFNKKIFDNKFSELARILDDFLIYESQVHPIEKELRNISLMKIYFERNVPFLAKRLLKALDTEKVKNVNYIKYQYYLYLLAYNRIYNHQEADMDNLMTYFSLHWASEWLYTLAIEKDYRRVHAKPKNPENIDNERDKTKSSISELAEKGILSFLESLLAERKEEKSLLFFYDLYLICGIKKPDIDKVKKAYLFFTNNQDLFLANQKKDIWALLLKIINLCRQNDETIENVAFLWEAFWFGIQARLIYDAKDLIQPSIYNNLVRTYLWYFENRKDKPKYEYWIEIQALMKNVILMEKDNDKLTNIVLENIILWKNNAYKQIQEARLSSKYAQRWQKNEEILNYLEICLLEAKAVYTLQKTDKSLKLEANDNYLVYLLENLIGLQKQLSKKEFAAIIAKQPKRAKNLRIELEMCIFIIRLYTDIRRQNSKKANEKAKEFLSELPKMLQCYDNNWYEKELRERYPW